MENIQVDKILTKAMGECWHEWIYKPNYTSCKNCNYMVAHNKKRNPSPSTNWKDYGEVIEWAKWQHWWAKFCTALRSTEYGDEPMLLITDPQQGSHALAEFLEQEGK